MFTFIVRLLLTAVFFCFLLPKMNCGASFHGAIWPDGIIYAAVFALIAGITSRLILWAATAFTVVTLGLGLFIVIPALVLGGWLIPALQLQVFAHFFPDQFTLANGWSAIWAGLVLMGINMMTTPPTNKSEAKSTSKG